MYTYIFKLETRMHFHNLKQNTFWIGGCMYTFCFKLETHKCIFTNKCRVLFSYCLLPTSQNCGLEPFYLSKNISTYFWNVVLYRCPCDQSSLNRMKKTKWDITFKYYKNGELTNFLEAMRLNHWRVIGQLYALHSRKFKQTLSLTLSLSNTMKKSLLFPGSITLFYKNEIQKYTYLYFT